MSERERDMIESKQLKIAENKLKQAKNGCKYLQKAQVDFKKFGKWLKIARNGCKKLEISRKRLK